jgi:predicted alpha/beta hydrolase
LLIPVATWLFGYFPGRLLGLKADLPAGVARNWARWGRNKYYISDLRGRPIRTYFDAFRAPIRAYSFIGDRFAPPKSVEALMSFYSNARKELRQVTPQELGLDHNGHLTFFKEKCRESLWRESAEWLEHQ